MNWRYQAVKRGNYIEIYEVYLTDEGKIHSYTENSIKAGGDDFKELWEDLRNMRDDVLKYGVINYEELPQ
jgi:uncharacterized OB-fold protein